MPTESLITRQRRHSRPSAASVEWLIKLGSLGALLFVTSPENEPWMMTSPFLSSSDVSSENANKQRRITSFCLLRNNRDSLLINDDIHLFSSPPLLSFVSRSCLRDVLLETGRSPLPMSLFSAVSLGKHWILARDESEDIPNPPESRLC